MTLEPGQIFAAGAGDRAAGLATAVGAVVVIAIVVIAMITAAEHIARLYARLWHERRGLVVSWALCSTALLVLAFVLWSRDLALVGGVGWIVQAVAWYAADSHASFEEYRGRPRPTKREFSNRAAPSSDDDATPAHSGDYLFDWDNPR